MKSNFWRVLMLAVTGWVTLLDARVVAQTTPTSGTVAAGTSFSAALKSDGTVWTWGLNSNGQLGDATTTQRLAPVAVPALTGVAALAAGDAHLLALRTDGTVRAWGKNTNGQLGDASTTQRTAPVTVSGLANVVAVAAGTSHSLAVKTDGTVWAWGLNTNGQLGDGTTTQRTSPVQISTLSGVVAVAAGASHSLALKSDGTVWAWGLNANGQLGDGTTTQRAAPVQIVSLTSVAALAAGSAHSLALRSDGTVRAWGKNTNGQLGDNSTTQRTAPVTVTGLTGAARLTAGANHSVAVKTDGTALAWGLNSSAQLGDGTTTQRNSPTVVLALANAIIPAAGGTHTLILRSDGGIAAFGANVNGQLGDGTTSSFRTRPVQASADVDFAYVDLGASHNLAVKTDGTAWAWGLNSNGQLGDNTTTQRNAPIQITSLTGVTRVAGGGAHSLAARTDGTLRVWGKNTNGQLGDGTTTQRNAPVALASFNGVSTVAAGANHSLALKTDGTVWSWGLNTNGQLGDGTTTQRTAPVQISTLANIIAIDAGDAFSLALKNDGTVWAWGLNSNGQLGDGSTTQRTVPVQISTLSGVTAIAAGATHSLALRNDGTVRAWGKNTNGQLGDNSTTQRTAPVTVTGLSGVTAIAAGANHSLAVKTDGTARAWGLNTNYQLGDGTVTQRNTSVAITGLPAVSRVSGGSIHSLALLVDSSLRSWGSHTNGQLGVTTLTRTTSALNLIASASDTDADGLVDTWETAAFGNLTQTATADPDADGLTNVQEAEKGTDPNIADIDQDRLTDLVDAFPGDYYNNITPTLAIVSGNNQNAYVGQFNAQPFDVAVWNSSGTAPLVNAPITYSVLSGGGQLALTGSGTPPLSSSLSLRSDLDGTAASFYQQPNLSTSSQVRATAGAAQVTFQTASLTSPSADDDGDGLTNSDEITRGTNPIAYDTDNDGIGDGVEVELALNPLVADRDSLPSKINGLRLLLKADSLSLGDGVPVPAWTDVSSLNNHGTQAIAGQQPILKIAQINNRSVVRFDGSDDYLNLPNLLNGATEGEIFAVLKMPEGLTRNHGLWMLGKNNGFGTRYFSGQYQDDFGSTTDFQNLGAPAVDITGFHLMNVSSKSGEWTSRFHGRIFRQFSNLGVQFRTDPKLGREGSYWLKGDIAEIIIYNRVLTAKERELIGQYLNSRYAIYPAPLAPAALLARSVSDHRITLAWTTPPRNDLVVYEIERRTASGAFVKIGETEGMGFLDVNLSAGGSYFYRVRARGLAGVSSYSPEILASTSNDGLADFSATGLRLWLGAESASAGSSVSFWPDRSAGLNHAIQPTATNQPIAVANQLNGQPVVRFDGTNDFFTLPNFMSGATQGEIFAVMKIASAPGRNQGLWRLGGGPSQYGTRYFSSSLNDDFGRVSDVNIGDPFGGTADFHLVNISAKPNEWAARYNGLVSYFTKSNSSVGFSSSPTLASAPGVNTLQGDIAEILVYDRVLSDQEREALGRYLGRKYLLFPPPAAPAGLIASHLSASQISLVWDSALRPDQVTYEIERKIYGGNFIKVAEIISSASYVDSALSPGGTYTYRVRMRSSIGFSNYSNESTISVIPTGTTMPLSNIRLWLKADAVGGNSSVVTWVDHSGLNNPARAPSSSNRATYIPLALNGRPVIRFDGLDDFYILENFMNGAGQGEIFAVMKMPAAPTRNEGLWRLGNGPSQYGTRNFSSSLNDDFGRTTDLNLGQSNPDATNYHLINVGSKAGDWFARFNASSGYRTSLNPGVGFISTPQIGAAPGVNNLQGDIAEIIVYDRMLNEQERESVGYYLNKKYNFCPLINFGYYRDSNSDGVTDAVNVRLGLDPYSSDTDGDGLPNVEELNSGLNPLTSDTDGDGVNDLSDAFPLDPSRSTAPSGTPGDTTAPAINLLLPLGATPLP